MKKRKEKEQTYERTQEAKTRAIPCGKITTPIEVTINAKHLESYLWQREKSTAIYFFPMQRTYVRMFIPVGCNAIWTFFTSAFRLKVLGSKYLFNRV